MKSVFRDITPAELFVELRMLRQRHKGVFILVEGAHDVRRFTKFLDESIALPFPCQGKSNLIETIDLTQNAGFEDCLGLADADFDRIEMCVVENEDIIHSEHHDFDLDLCRLSILARYFEEVAITHKLEAAGGCEALVSSLLKELKPLSALRYANTKLGLGYSLTAIELSDFFDGHAINVQDMVSAVSGGRFRSAAHRAKLKSLIERYASADFDLWQFTNGHDLIAGIGIALRNRIGNRAILQSSRREVEKHLRLTFDWAEFHATGLAGKIAAWQANRNAPPIIKQVV